MLEENIQNRLLESTRTQEIQQMEQLFQIVLQWRSRQQHFVADLEFTQGAEKLKQKPLSSTPHIQKSQTNSPSIDYSSDDAPRR